MAKKSSKNANLLSVVSFITLLVILVSVFVLSGSFSDLVTTINKSKASQANPKTTESFADPFNDGNVNDAKWLVQKSIGTTVVETATDNLRLDIPAGGLDGKPQGASITFKELLKDNGDFRAMAVVYKPIVTGEGSGVTGVRFSSKGADDDESAGVQWRINGATSKVIFFVNGADGKRMETGHADIKSNVAVLRLDRINKKYRAFYKVGADMTADTSWISLGSEINATLGNEGHLSVFTNNAAGNTKFAKVAGRVDQINFGWEGDPRTRDSFSDAFADGVLAKNWKVGRSDGAQAYENKGDNLILALSTGSANGKTRYVHVVRTTPSIPENKDFTLVASMFKPAVVGAGQGFAGLGFVSTGSSDDEAAAVRWHVSGTTVNRLVFVVRAPDGSLSERASVNVASTVKKLTFRLTRVGDKYAAFYRLSQDGDAEFLRIGTDVSSNFGAAGHVLLNVNNIGLGGKFPRVIGQFDQVSGSVAK